MITKRIKSAVTDSETEVRFDPEAKPGVSQPAHDPRRLHRPRRRDRGRVVRRSRATARSRATPPRRSSRSPQPFAARVRELGERPGRAARGSWPRAPPRRAPSPPPTLADGLRPARARARPAGSDRRSDPHRGRHRGPGPVGRRARALARLASATRRPARSRRTSRCCRPPRSTRAGSTTSRRTWRRPPPRRRPSRSTCAARAPSGRCRRWCSWRWPTGIAGCERLEARVRRGTARPRPRLPVPPARHGGARPARRRARRGLRRARRLRRPVRGQRVLRSTCTAPTGSGTSARAFPLAG